MISDSRKPVATEKKGDSKLPADYFASFGLGELDFPGLKARLGGGDKGSGTVATAGGRYDVAYQTVGHWTLIADRSPLAANAPKSPPMRLRIGAKSVGLFCIVGLLPVIILSVASFMSARDAMQRVVADNLALSARETVDNLERFFEATKTDLATWSQLRVMQDALIDDQEGEIATDLGQLISRYPQFAELAVLNAAGRVGGLDRRRRPRPRLVGQ